MEELKKKNSLDRNDKEIIFSKSIKAGKRIYYLDVKKNRKDELFLAITESKKIVMGGEDSLINAQVSFEKHKIFLYKEDFEKFTEGLHEAISFIQDNTPRTTTENTESEQHTPITAGLSEDELKIDIDF